MKKTICGAAAAAVLLWGTSASAQTTLASQALIATATVGNQARLSVTGTVDFADSDPDTVPSINGGTVDVQARARVSPGTQLNVTVTPGDTHFDPLTDTIPVGAISWTVTGASFLPSASMSTGTSNLAQWTGPSNQTGTQSYALANSWNYAPGSYTLLITYTLSTP